MQIRNTYNNTQKVNAPGAGKNFANRPPRFPNAKVLQIFDVCKFILQIIEKGVRGLVASTLAKPAKRRANNNNK